MKGDNEVRGKHVFKVHCRVDPADLLLRLSTLRVTRKTQRIFRRFDPLELGRVGPLGLSAPSAQTSVMAVRRDYETSAAAGRPS